MGWLSRGGCRMSREHSPPGTVWLSYDDLDALVDSDPLRLRDAAIAMRAAIRKVEMLHYTADDGPTKFCRECGFGWPCRTKRALQSDEIPAPTNPTNEETNGPPPT